MLFSDRLLFLHVPKAGGTSIVRYLIDVLPKPVYYSLPVGHEDGDVPDGVTRFHGVAHESLEEARAVLRRWGRRLEDFPLVVSCVRNPYELEVSRFAFLRRDLERFMYGPGPQQAIALLDDFELFAVYSRPHGSRAMESYFVLEGLVPRNLRIVRLENVAVDLADCLASVGVEVEGSQVPHRNRSTHDPFATYYTAAAERAVYEKYKWVFDHGLYPRLGVSEQSPSEPGFANPEEVDRLVASRSPALDGDDFARANLWLAAAEIHRHHLRPWAQLEALEQALAVGSERLIPPIAQEIARGRSLVGVGTVAEGIATCRAAVDLAGGGWRSGGIRLNLALLLAAAARIDEARVVCEEVSASSSELALGAASYAGCVELLAGDTAAAGRRFEDGWWSLPTLPVDRADALYRIGRFEEVDRIARFTESTAPAYDVRSQARWRRLRAKLVARAGECQPAAELAREAVALTRRCEATNLEAGALVDLAEVLSTAVRRDEALAVLSEALVLYERKGNIASARQTSELLERTRTAADSRELSAPAS